MSILYHRTVYFLSSAYTSGPTSPNAAEFLRVSETPSSFRIFGDVWEMQKKGL